MPANLPPEYLAAEHRFRQAKSPDERMAALQDMLSVIPKHKGTDKLRGQLRSKLSKLREESQRKKSTGRTFYLFNVKKEGAGQILLVGLPNVGKSTLLSRLTNASVEIGDYPFTTRVPIVGMMSFENIQIQLVDAPAVTLELGEAWFSNLVRNADALMLVLDLGWDPMEQMRVILESLGEAGVTPVGEKNARPCYSTTPKCASPIPSSSSSSSPWQPSPGGQDASSAGGNKEHPLDQQQLLDLITQAAREGWTEALACSIVGALSCIAPLSSLLVTHRQRQPPLESPCRHRTFKEN